LCTSPVPSQNTDTEHSQSDRVPGRRAAPQRPATAGVRATTPFREEARMKATERLPLRRPGGAAPGGAA
jgi:hypothetical protein